MKHVLIILATGLITGLSVYGFSQETLEERIETENQEILSDYAKEQKDCYANATGTSNQILRKYDSCSNRPKPKLKTISSDGNTGSGGERIKITGTHSTGSTMPTLDEEKLQECLSKYKKIDNTISNICMDYAEGKRTDNIEFEIVTERLSQLHKKVCKKQINSPLCKDRALFDRLYQLTEERLPGKNFYPILIGMTNAESSLGLDYAKDKIGGTCAGRNNWGGAKYMIKDDNTRVYKRNPNGFDYKYPRDQYDCNLFPFQSIEEYWISKVNGIRYGYPGCVNSKTPIRCLSGKYVGSPFVEEQSWINNVSIFL